MTRSEDTNAATGESWRAEGDTTPVYQETERVKLIHELDYSTGRARSSVWTGPGCAWGLWQPPHLQYPSTRPR